MQTIRLILASLHFTLLAACTFVMEIPKGATQSNLAEQRKPIKVALELDDTFRKFDWKYKACSTCDTFVFPLGEHLVSRSENVARSVYANVVTVSDETQLPGDVQLVVKPTVVKVDGANSLWAWNYGVMTIIIEWKLMTPDRQPKWVKAIKGSGQSEMGTLFSFKEQWTGRAKLMLDDVFRNAYAELTQIEYFRFGPRFSHVQVGQ